MRKSGKTALIIVLILALTAGVIGAGYGYSAYRKGQIYTQKIQAGDRYFATGDYDNAILMYQDAIKIDDTDERGYLKLADSYIEKEYLILAVDILERGYEKTKSPRIQQMLDRLQEGGSVGGGSKQPVLNVALLKKINESSYGDYVARNEVASVRMNGTAEAIVRLNGVAADLIYRNIDQLPEVIAGNQILENALPAEVHFDDLVSLFGVAGMLTIEQIKALEFESVELINSGADYALRMMYMGATILVPSDVSGNVDTGNACIMEPDNSWTSDVNNKTHSGEIETFGTVEDAQSGVGIPSVTMTFYEGGIAEGDPVATLETDENGNYSVNLESGRYRVILKKEGYSDADKEIYIGSYSSEHKENFVLSAESGNEIRIVLEWDGGACDLDSYVRGNGELMNFRNPQLYSGGSLAVSLDRDARSAPGVETTTIYDMNGTYEYFIFDYYLSGTMQSSGATVTIYAPGESPQKVYIPSDAGNTWYVCKIEAGSVRITNYMAEEGSSYAPK